MDQPELNPESAPVDGLQVLAGTVEVSCSVHGGVESLPEQRDAGAGSGLPERDGFSCLINRDQPPAGFQQAGVSHRRGCAEALDRNGRSSQKVGGRGDGSARVRCRHQHSIPGWHDHHGKRAGGQQAIPVPQLAREPSAGAKLAKGRTREPQQEQEPPVPQLTREPSCRGWKEGIG